MTQSIPIKPQNVTWTDEQWHAIWETGQDTLVSAAAGSGKTAVLINRLIEKVISKTNPIDVDELLVVTFTNASASEMRHRMAEALEKEIAKDPKNAHLRRQLSLVNKAQISTLHSFCLNVVRQYAYLLDIDPGFRIGNEGEMTLLKDDVLAEVLEEAYNTEDADKLSEVYRLVDSFTSDRDDQAIEILIEKLYEMSRVQPEPKKWLHSLPTKYKLPENIQIDDLDFMDTLKQSILFSLEEALAHAREIRKFSLMPDGPAKYGETADLDIQLLQGAIDVVRFESWEVAYNYFQGFNWSKLASVKKDSCDPELQERAKKKRDEAKKIIEKLKKSFFLRTPERLLQEIRIMGPIIGTLVELTENFSDKFQAAKLERGIVDFSDLEHYALAILTEERNNQLEPSPIAKEYQKKFKEVLVDEYQDTNMIQETILQLVKSGTESNGNMFMVGDVKQSIYRFRLAEPRLFLTKYNEFLETPNNSGLKIDLNANFRSRKEVLHGTNFIFEQIMGTTVGEIEYDEKAKLKPKAPYDDVELPVEVAIIHDDEEQTDEKEEQIGEETTVLEEEIENSQQEARFIINKIRELMDNNTMVYDIKEKNPSKKYRPLRYSDIVILMRSMTWASDLLEEFKQANIPLYAESSKGYFEAIEVMVMINLLKIVDNPYQDIPLASVLRAPFIGLTENELATIRLAKRNAPFFDALTEFVSKEQNGVNSKTQEKLKQFLVNLDVWRDLARTGSLSDLIWKIYLDTNYYEMVGAMSNGKQRQANLRALHDRAMSYEKTSFRGLFRFLRFIDRMRLRGDDLGEAKAIGEKDDVVRIVTIHSSKGLEYPVVFVAGLGRKFNESDFRLPYLFDQQYGLAVKAVDPDLQIELTSLPYLAMKEKKMLEMKAEEMRILYVALTRAKERLILVGSVKDLQKKLSTWCEYQNLPIDEMLPDYLRAKANNYLDWIGPAISRHEDFKLLSGTNYTPIPHDSKWEIKAYPKSVFLNPAGNSQDDKNMTTNLDSKIYEEIEKRFSADYPHPQAIFKQSKTSVSEIKRIENKIREEETEQETAQLIESKPTIMKRPNFIQQSKKLTQAEIGTIVHTVMQHVPQSGFESKEAVEAFCESLASSKLLSEDEVKEVDAEKILSFFNSPIGERFKKAKRLYRELPFTYSRKDHEGDAQIIQGIIDCLMEDEQGNWILLDFKTDKILPAFASEPQLTNEMKNRYEVQLKLYSEAVQSILNIQISEKVLYLYNAEKEIYLN